MTGKRQLGRPPKSDAGAKTSTERSRDLRARRKQVMAQADQLGKKQEILLDAIGHLSSRLITAVRALTICEPNNVEAVRTAWMAFDRSGEGGRKAHEIYESLLPAHLRLYELVLDDLAKAVLVRAASSVE
jgi:hypothetical protein